MEGDGSKGESRTGKGGWNILIRPLDPNTPKSDQHKGPFSRHFRNFLTLTVIMRCVVINHID